MGSFILALDQGTTSSRAILFDRSGRVAAMAQQTFPQHYPQPGWVEHDPLELWESQRSVAAQALEELGPDARIAGIGITNQRETTILWDKATGEPVYNAIVWQCRRTAGICDKLKETPGMAETIADVIDTKCACWLCYFAACAWGVDSYLVSMTSTVYTK